MTRTLPRTQRDFVKWCKGVGHPEILMGTVQHDLRNIKAIANKYGYKWDSTVSLGTNISNTAILLEDYFKSDRPWPDVTVEISEPPTKPKVALKIIDKPAVQENQSWGSW